MFRFRYLEAGLKKWHLTKDRGQGSGIRDRGQVFRLLIIGGAADAAQEKKVRPVHNNCDPSTHADSGVM